MALSFNGGASWSTLNFGVNIYTTEYFEEWLYCFALGGRVFRVKDDFSVTEELVTASRGLINPTDGITATCVLRGELYAFSGLNSSGGGSNTVFKLIDGKFVLIPSNLFINQGDGGKIAEAWDNAVWGTAGYSYTNGGVVVGGAVFSIMSNY